MRRSEPGPAVKRLTDAYLQRQGINPAPLTAAVWFWMGRDDAEWRVDYWKLPPQGDYPIDYPISERPEAKSNLTVYVARSGHMWHVVHRELEVAPALSNQYIMHANEVLRQHGYDPIQYESRLWFFGQWHVDYWKKGVKLTDFLVPPALVVHLGFPTMADKAHDELEIPIDPRTAKSKQKR